MLSLTHAVSKIIARKISFPGYYFSTSNFHASQIKTLLAKVKTKPRLVTKLSRALQSLLPMFEEWREEDLQTNASFLIHWRGKPVDKIKRAWVAALRRAGITRRIRPYDLRHAFATELIACGTDIGTVAKLMGHNSPTMIFSHYQHVMDSQKRSAIESLPDIEYVSKAMCPKNKALTTIQ